MCRPFLISPAVLGRGQADSGSFLPIICVCSGAGLAPKTCARADADASHFPFCLFSPQSGLSTAETTTVWRPIPVVDQMRGLRCGAIGRQMRCTPSWGLRWPCPPHCEGSLRAKTTNGDDRKFRGCSMGGFDKNGPNSTSAVSCDSAMQLHQTGHSCIAQHFRGSDVGRADEALSHFIRANSRFVLPSSKRWLMTRSKAFEFCPEY